MFMFLLETVKKPTNIKLKQIMFSNSKQINIKR